MARYAILSIVAGSLGIALLAQAAQVPSEMTSSGLESLANLTALSAIIVAFLYWVIWERPAERKHREFMQQQLLDHFQEMARANGGGK